MPTNEGIEPSSWNWYTFSEPYKPTHAEALTLLVIDVLHGERLWRRMGGRFVSVWPARTGTVSMHLKWNKGLSGLMRPRAESSVDGSESFCDSETFCSLNQHPFCWGGVVARWRDSAHHFCIEDEARKPFHGCFFHFQIRHNWKQGGEKGSTIESNRTQWGTFHSASLLTSPPPDPFFYECKHCWLCSYGFSLQKKSQSRTLILNSPVQYTSLRVLKESPLQTPN